jgi:CheY-like chemotaxis protein
MRPKFSGRVLVVEDNPVNQKLALALLSSYGCQSKVANNGAEALHILAEQSFDAIFMDCQMPVMDGYQATAQIRQREIHGAPRSPIIAMTAHAMSGDRERCIAAGMDDYVTKPVKIQALEETLMRWLKPAPGPSLPPSVPADTPAPLAAMTENPRVAGDAAGPIDFSILEDMRAFQMPESEGFPDLVRDVVEQFLADLQERRQAVLQAEGGPETAEPAHALKSASAVVGALRLSEMCAELERKAKAGSTILPLLSAFDSECNAVNLALAAFLNAPNSSKT